MGSLDRQTIAFAAAVLAAALGTLALGADAALPSLVGGAAFCALALLSGQAAPLPAAFWLGAATALWLAVRAAITDGLGLAAPELGAMAGIAGAFAVGVQAGHVPARVKRAAAVLTAALGAFAVLAFVAHVASPDTILGRPKPYHRDRLTGTFLSANTAATLAGLGLVLGLAGLRRAASGSGSIARGLDAIGRGGLASGLLAVFAATCLLLTGSRGGLLAGLAGSAVVLVPGAGRRLGVPAAVGLGAVCLLLLAVSGSVLGDRLAEGAADGSGRASLWAVSVAAWAEAPVFGHGLGSFARAVAPHVTAETAPVLAVQGAAHDAPLQWLVQTGLVGTALGALTLAALARRLIRGVATGRRGRWIVRAALAGLAVFAAHGLVDYAFEVPAATWWLALLTGLGAGAARGEAEVTQRRAAR